MIGVKNNLKQMIGAGKKLPLGIHENVAKTHFKTRCTGLKTQIYLIQRSSILAIMYSDWNI